MFCKREKSGFWKRKRDDFVEPNDLANHILSKTCVKVLWTTYPNGLLKTLISKKMFYFVGILREVVDIFLLGYPHIFFPIKHIL